jgi:heme oxygenase
MRKPETPNGARAVRPFASLLSKIERHYVQNLRFNRFMNRALAYGHDATVRKRLQEATAAIHQTLHEVPAFVRLLEDRITVPEYRALLARLYGFHEPLERGLREAAPEILDGFDVHARERSPALRSDLIALGMTGAEIALLPICDRLPQVRSNAGLLGRLYVIEGAALGGKVLAARLDRLLGEGNAEGRMFLAGRTAPDPLPWPAFCRRLETPRACADLSAIIESADTTFHAMAHWLCEGAPHV